MSPVKRNGGRHEVSEHFSELDATALAEQIRKGETTAEEVLEQSIARIETVNPGINAVIHPLFEKARKQLANGEIADGPFYGVPLLVKDLL